MMLHRALEQESHRFEAAMRMRIEPALIARTDLFGTKVIEHQKRAGIVQIRSRKRSQHSQSGRRLGVVAVDHAQRAARLQPCFHFQNSSHCNLLSGAHAISNNSISALSPFSMTTADSPLALSASPAPSGWPFTVAIPRATCT